MTFYPVVRTQGAVFTIEAQLDISLDDAGAPMSEQKHSIGLFLTVSPAIEAAEIFESRFPDMPEFDLLVKTPNACLYTQILDAGLAGWTVNDVVEYLQECIPEMVSYLDWVETGTFFTQTTQV